MNECLDAIPHFGEKQYNGCRTPPNRRNVAKVPGASCWLASRERRTLRSSQISSDNQRADLAKVPLQTIANFRNREGLG